MPPSSADERPPLILRSMPVGSNGRGPTLSNFPLCSSIASDCSLVDGDDGSSWLTAGVAGEAGSWGWSSDSPVVSLAQSRLGLEGLRTDGGSCEMDLWSFGRLEIEAVGEDEEGGKSLVGEIERARSGGKRKSEVSHSHSHSARKLSTKVASKKDETARRDC